MASRYAQVQQLTERHIGTVSAPLVLSESGPTWQKLSLKHGKA
ncbi:hypothetical protein [Streptomyces sp. NPDC057302]